MPQLTPTHSFSARCPSLAMVAASQGQSEMAAKARAVWPLVALILALLMPRGGQARIRNRIDVSEIPDMEYTVYYYDGYHPSNMMVVLDIPDDGFRVFMYHTMFTRRGVGHPDRYIEKFRWRIKGFKTAYQILDRTGQVRGYLMSSRFLWYQFLSFEDRIGVRVRDYFGGRR